MLSLPTESTGNNGSAPEDDVDMLQSPHSVILKSLDKFLDETLEVLSKTIQDTKQS